PEGGRPRVLDPSCGSGHFLVAVVRRFVAGGMPPSEAVACVHGVDVDPVAVAITQLLLRLEAPGCEVEPDVVVGDGLAHRPAESYDVVVGNPPFLGQLRRRTASARPAGAGAYTDTSALFLRHALDLVVPGGVVGLVQPLSLLAARDAAPVRGVALERAAITAFWSSPTAVFPGAAVLTCAPVLRLGERSGPVPTWSGPDFEPGPTVVLDELEWGPLAAPSVGIPVVSPQGAGTLADLGSCTADFRDQYYGLVPFVREGGTGAPLVTSGLIDPAECRWGRRPTRFARTDFECPTVDLAALRHDGRLGDWADRRLVPKVLVATQGRVIEAVADPEGAWLPSVPVLTMAPHDPTDVWRVLAVLLAPPVAAAAAARYFGTALSARAIKLSARQVAELPLPVDLVAWAAGADLAKLAQTGPAGHRPAVLRELARVMGEAYGETAAEAWWIARAGV
ncbi:MAG: N-6 DNA methylase, partial [Nocardioides sp.]